MQLSICIVNSSWEIVWGVSTCMKININLKHKIPQTLKVIGQGKTLKDSFEKAICKYMTI